MSYSVVIINLLYLEYDPFYERIKNYGRDTGGKLGLVTKFVVTVLSEHFYFPSFNIIF